MTAHKHAELIKLWADNVNAEIYNFLAVASDWNRCSIHYVINNPEKTYKLILPDGREYTSDDDGFREVRK